LGKLDFDPAWEWELVKLCVIATSMQQSFSPASAKVPTQPAFVLFSWYPLRIGESKELGNGADNRSGTCTG